MAKRLTPDGEFVVRQEKIINYILVVLCLAVFLYGLADLFFITGLKDNMSGFAFLFALLPAVINFVKARRDPVALRINRKGIYEGHQLVCDWAHQHKSYIAEQPPKFFQVADNFVLVVEYITDGSDTGVRRKIQLTNTHNKSEEQIMEAVRYYGGLWAAQNV